jgi:hypothetical protein
MLVDSKTLRRLGDTIPIPSGVISQIAFSADGRFLAALDSQSRAVHLIDLHAKAPIGDPIPGIRHYEWFDFSPDSRFLVLAHPGASLLLDLDTEHWRAAACARARRELTRDEFNRYFSAADNYTPVCSS